MVITILLFALSSLLKKRTLTIVAIRSIKLQIIMPHVFFKSLKTILYYYRQQNIGILYDNGAQLNYIIPKTFRELKLSSIDKK